MSAKASPMNLKYVVLGILVDHPAHGYELKQLLSPGLARNQMMNDGVLYPLLKRMEKEGLIRKTVRASAHSPNRRVFHTTVEGRRVFQAWLVESTQEEDEITYDFFLGHLFLLKCMFFKHLPREGILGKIRAQSAAAEEKREAFRRIRAGMVERGADPFRIAILDLGIEQHREQIVWLEKLSKTVARRRGDKR